MYIKLSRSEVQALEMQTLKLRLWTGLMAAFIIGVSSWIELMVLPGKEWLVFALIVILLILFWLIYAKNLLAVQSVIYVFFFISPFILVGLMVLGLWDFTNLILIFMGVFLISSALLDY